MRRVGDVEALPEELPAGVGDIPLARTAVPVDAHEHGGSISRASRLERELLCSLLHKRHVVDLDAGVACHVVARVEEAPVGRVLDVGVLVERFDGAAGDESVAGVEIAVAVLEACHAAFDRRRERQHGRTVLVELHAIDTRLRALLVVAVGVICESKEQDRPVGLGRVERPILIEIGFTFNGSIVRGEREVSPWSVNHSRVAREVERDGRR